MTRDELATRIRFNLDDAGVTFYSANDINNSLQEGYHEIVAIAQPIESLVTLNWTGNLSYYNLNNLISDYIRPLAIFDNRGNRWLENKGLPFLQSQRQDFESINGAPFWYHVLDYKYIVISPKYSDTSGTFDVLYKSMANTLSGSTTPSLPDSLITVLEFYSTADLLEQAEEYPKAERYWFGDKNGSLGYFDYLERIKREVISRELPDRFHILRDQYLQANTRDATLTIR